jgi:hypothetical protein
LFLWRMPMCECTLNVIIHFLICFEKYCWLNVYWYDNWCIEIKIYPLNKECLVWKTNNDNCFVFLIFKILWISLCKSSSTGNISWNIHSKSTYDLIYNNTDTSWTNYWRWQSNPYMCHTRRKSCSYDHLVMWWNHSDNSNRKSMYILTWY